MNRYVDVKLREYLSRKDAADYANVSIDTIDRWVANGFVEKIKTNPAKIGKVLIPRKSIEKFLNSLLCKISTRSL